MYGETIAILLRSLGASQGVAPFNAAAFLTHYNNSFGVGGSYVGYADKLSRTMVRSLLQLADAQQAAMGPLGAIGAHDHALMMAAFAGLKKLVDSTPREELAGAVEALAKAANPSAAPADVAVLQVRRSAVLHPPPSPRAIFSPCYPFHSCLQYCSPWRLSWRLTSTPGPARLATSRVCWPSLRPWWRAWRATPTCCTRSRGARAACR